MTFKFLFRQGIAALVGGICGLALLAGLMLPHEWKPMGRWDTFKVFSLFLSGWHVAVWLLVLVPLSLVIRRRGSQLKMSQAILIGGGTYCIAEVGTQLCFDHLGVETVWFLILAFIVGGITQLTFVALDRSATAGANPSPL